MQDMLECATKTRVDMPRKIRQLRAELAREGFDQDTRRGKGSHTWWEHPTGVSVNLPGQDGADAKPYMEKAVRNAIREVRKREAQKGP